MGRFRFTSTSIRVLPIWGVVMAMIGVRFFVEALDRGRLGIAVAWGVAIVGAAGCAGIGIGKLWRPRAGVVLTVVVAIPVAIVLVRAAIAGNADADYWAGVGRAEKALRPVCNAGTGVAIAAPLQPIERGLRPIVFYRRTPGSRELAEMGTPHAWLPADTDRAQLVACIDEPFLEPSDRRCSDKPLDLWTVAIRVLEARTAKLVAERRAYGQVHCSDARVVGGHVAGWQITDGDLERAIGDLVEPAERGR